MKKTFAIFLTLLYALMVLVGCGGSESPDSEIPSDPDNPIVGSWQSIDTFDTSEANSDNAQNSNTSESDVPEFNYKSEVTTVYTFYSDGKYKEEMTNNYTLNGEENSETSLTEGTYKLDGSKMTLTMDNLDGKTKEQVLEEFSSMDNPEQYVKGFDPYEVTVKVNGDTLTMENEDIEKVEFTRVKA